MMREKVCIVLNEREPVKAKIAQALANRFSDYGITTSRIPVDEHVSEAILSRQPRLLILDYLLGDFTTGLDVLGQLQSLETERRPKTIFFTDEPSVHVAVEAMKLGALDYHECDNPQSIDKIVRDANEFLKLESKPRSHARKRVLGLGDLIAQSQPAQQLIRSAQLLAKRQSPVVLIHGKPGSGLSALAHALQTERESHDYLVSFDLRTFDGTLDEILERGGAGGPALGTHLSLIIDNAQDDDGELLETLSTRFKEFWKRPAGTDATSFLTVCTTCSKTAQAWKTLVAAEVLNIPALDERKSDIPALIQRFIIETEALLEEKVKPFDSNIIAGLQEEKWPYQIKQLRSVVIDAAIASTFDKRPIKELIDDARQRWADWEAQTSNTPTLNSLSVRATLEENHQNYRISAAKLGCSVKQLRDVMRAQ